jgi:hypothetical protein
VPEWICALIKACDAKGASQNRVAGRLGCTGAVVSQVIRNKYGAKTDNIEAGLRAVYLDGKADFPALGPIDSETCMNWRDVSEILTSAQPDKVMMFVACRKCNRNPPKMTTLVTPKTVCCSFRCHSLQKCMSRYTRVKKLTPHLPKLINTLLNFSYHRPTSC